MTMSDEPVDLSLKHNGNLCYVYSLFCDALCY